MTTPPRKRRWRKTLTRAGGRAILCLLLGAVTTVGVTYVVVDKAAGPRANRTSDAATLMQGGAMLIFREEPAVWHTRRYVSMRNPLAAPSKEVSLGFGAESSAKLTEAAERTAAQEDALVGDNWRQTPLARRMLAGGWGRLPEHGSNVGVHATAFGWPRRALWSYIEHKESGAVVDGGTVLIGRHGRPFLPIPSGFLLDTLFYAAPWWLILIAPRAIRRFRRRRRGRCIHCGYDLAGLPGGTVPGGTVLRTVTNKDDGETGRQNDTARRAVPPTCPECGA